MRGPGVAGPALAPPASRIPEGGRGPENDQLAAFPAALRRHVSTPHAGPPRPVAADRPGGGPFTRPPYDQAVVGYPRARGFPLRDRRLVADRSHSVRNRRVRG